MTDDTEDLEPIDLSAPPTWPEGWYADPWTAGQYRYWNGASWTGETNRWGPANAAFEPRGVTSPWPAAPAASGYTGTGYGPPNVGAPNVAGPYVPPRRPRGPIVAAVIGLVLLLLVSAVIGYAINSSSQSDDGALSVPGTTNPSGGGSPGGGTSPTTPGSIAPQDPASDVLGGLVVRQADVGAGRTVLLIPGGNLTTMPTLDLCNGTYPSEQLRTARLQVAAVNDAGNTLLSTEAVLYRNPAAARQGLAELRNVRAACPRTPVKSPVSEQTTKTVFKAAPDGAWPHTPTVDRQAYSFVSTVDGESSASIAVYLRRGRVLVGLYFLKPTGAQPEVAGKTTIPDIVGVFEARIAALPQSVVDKP